MLTVAATLVVGGCTTLRRRQAGSQEELLAAAGFRMKAADTPARQAALAAMPPLRIMLHWKDGNPVYTYADRYRCQCLWVGGAAEYGRYHHLGLEKKIGDERLAAALAHEDAAPDWNLWGPR